MGKRSHRANSIDAVRILAVPLISCVAASGKLIHLFLPQFPSL